MRSILIFNKNNMKKEIIEKYIQFWIDNGYIEHCYIWIDDEEYVDFYLRWHFETWVDDEILKTINLYKLITSKEFIEAIARGIENLKDNNNKIKIMWHRSYEPTYRLLDKKDTILWVEDLINDITYFQALAIRDKNLENFIINLLEWWTEKLK